MQGKPTSDHAGDRFRLFAAATALLTAHADRRPLLVVLDDLHRADEASLAMLRFLAPALVHAPLLVLGAYRHTEVGVTHPLSRLLGEVAGDVAFDLVELAGLSRDDVAVLVNGTGAEIDPDEVHRRTGGNPFFVTEVLRLDPDGHRIPTTVDAAIRARVERLPGPSRELLEPAAVLGREVDVGILAALTGQPLAHVLDSVRPAVDAGLLADTADGFRFVHILVQEALYDGIAAPRRSALHERAVTVLEAAGSDPARLAHHAALAAGRAGGHQRAYDLACRAARASADRLADEEAADWYDRALALAPGHPPVDLFLALGRCAGRAGRVDTARDAFERAWASADDVGDLGRLVAAALGLGDVVVSAGRVDSGLVRMLERTLDRLPSTAAGDRSRVDARLAIELYWGPELPRARRLADGAVALARSGVTDPAVLPAVLAAAQFVQRGPDGLDRRVALGRELVAAAVRAGDEDAEQHGLRMLIPDLMQVDAVAAAAGLTELADLAARSRRPIVEWYELVYRAMRAIMMGAPAAAALVDRAESAGRRIRAQPATVYAAGQRFALRDRLGPGVDIEGEQRRLAAGYPVLSIFRCTLAVVLVESGSTEEAAAF